MTAGSLIREARLTAKLSQTELASRAGTSQPALARYEGSITVPALPTLERLLAACGAQLDLDVTYGVGRVRPRSSARAGLGEVAGHLRRNRKRLLELARTRGLVNVRVFGSVARGEATDASDVDLLVDMQADATLLDLSAFKRQASSLLGVPVDVTTFDMVKPRARDRIKKDAVPL